MKIPILILTLERPIQLRDMIVSIEANTDPSLYRLIICDNNSIHPDMVEYLKELEQKHTVIRNGINMVFEGFNAGLKLVDTDYFILTDPDIMLTDKIPFNWPTLLRDILIERPEIPKVGLALDINFDKDTALTKWIRGCEAEAWRIPTKVTTVLDDCFITNTDTTMCMYRRDTFSYWKDGPLMFDKAHGIVDFGYLSQDFYNPKYMSKPIRMAGRFTAKHLGWYTDEKYLPNLYQYNSRCHKRISSTLFNSLKMIKAHHAKQLHVLVVNLDNLKFTKDCVNDLMRQSDMDFDLTVVDNASNELDTEIYMDSLLNNGINVIKLTERMPLNHVWNQTFDDNEGAEYLCFLNNDVRVAHNYISTIKEAFACSPEVDIIGHVTNNPEYHVKDKLELKEFYRQMRQGWDYTIRRTAFVRIPDTLKVYFGDDWIYAQVYNSKRKAALILNSPMIHFIGQSIKSLRGREYEDDEKVFHSYGLTNGYSLWSGVSLTSVKQVNPKSFFKYDAKLLTINVVTYGRYSEFRNMLEILKAQTDPRFVADIWQDGPDLQKRELVEDLEDERFVYNENPSGTNKYGHDMRHQSIMKCETPYWCTMNDDNLLSPFFVEIILKKFGEFDMVKHAVAMENITWGGVALKWNEAEDRIRHGDFNASTYTPHFKVLDPVIDKIGDVDAASFAVKTEVLKKNGGWWNLDFSGDWYVYEKLLQNNVTVNRIPEVLVVHR